MTTQEMTHSVLIKAVVAILMLELVLLFYSSIVGGNLGGVSCANQFNTNPTCQITVHESNINATLTSFTHSFNCVSNSANDSSCSIRSPVADASVDTGLNGVYVGFLMLMAWLINGIAGLIQLILYFILIVFQLLILVAFEMLVFFPYLLNVGGLGAIGTVVGYVFDAVDAILAIYVLIIVIEYVVELASALIP